MDKNDELDDEIHQLNTRMALVEKDLSLIAGMRKWIVTGVFAIIIQAGGVVYTYGQLTTKVEQLGGLGLSTDVSTALQVLADHGTEFEGVRIEQARVRERIDVLTDRDYPVSDYDIEKLEKRMERIEVKVYK